VIISKHIHSCLLVEDAGIVYLIDPGNYTFDYQGLELEEIKKIDYILITHEHPDHMGIPLIKAVLAKFPQARIISNQSVADILIKDQIPVATTGNEHITLEEAPHEKVFGTEPPVNTVFKINNILTHPGDTHHLTSTTKVLALPIQAPWGSTTEAVELALKLKPQIIIPIHDWHWNDTARDTMYAKLESYFEKFNIKFAKIGTGDLIEV
jgi:L-ascorbate metabolism protein UlaG (beta-lactamase superfamily)